ncbi:MULTISPECIES: sensor histidine kinase KdpD [unclassified Flavobacterium]|uniref:sensor histidine kinase n=1 Tax=unclassified Flavobacterium TaxID=196869 RepID=UPI001F14345F|nr:MULTISPECIES: HAMP domain-containing sensor histidine kinase [unclassified Flavobacterium]UMY66234.1 HAMP domain-containing histidine kinase [Flavobacterium sp. HJ-32-4]
MKLVTRTSLYYLVSGIPVMIISGFVCYKIATEEIRENSDLLLGHVRHQVEGLIKRKDTASLHSLLRSGEAYVRRIPKVEEPTVTFSDTLIADPADPGEDELNVNRMITADVNIRNQGYRIKVWRTTMQSGQLVLGISAAVLTVLLFLCGIYFILNYYTSQWLWRPFYRALDNLRGFRASEGETPVFVDSKITEFKELNASLEQMMQTMVADYGRQKKFSEAVSHEIQTPLAVIKSKIDILIQSPDLTDKMAPLVASIDDACSKLIRMSRSLILLTRIENKQFPASDGVSFLKKIKSALALFDDHLKEKGLSLKVEEKGDFQLTANADLCLVLVNNLVQNAIRYNYPGGSIDVTVEENLFQIANTGPSVALRKEGLFKRFNKNAEVKDSIGLGLSIAAEIANASGLVLRYDFEDGLHVFRLTRAD